jgi:Spy/CpxP family protein refolding chaperone
MNIQRTLLTSALGFALTATAAMATTPPQAAPTAHAPPPGAPAPMPAGPGNGPGANIAGPGSPFANLNLTADQQQKIQVILTDARSQIMKLQEDTKGRIDKVLTPEQKTKLEADMQAQRARMMQMRQGGMNQQAGGVPPQPPVAPAQPARAK